MSDYMIARKTGVPRATVQRWRHKEPTWLLPQAVNPEEWRPPEPEQYCYLLGIYLGDGHVVARGASGFVRLYLDDAYAGITDAAACALAYTFPGARVSEYRFGTARRVILQVSNPAVLPAFPQHGPGRKHERPIRLEPWQAELCREYPDALIRGLIDSDGCRTINRFKTRLPSGRVAEYAYPRYFFTNVSQDIRAIFCEHCDLLGIRWSRSNWKNISVSDRRSVRRLDEFVGSKE